MIDADSMEKMKEDVYNIPWNYTPKVKEMNAIIQLKNALEEYMAYLEQEKRSKNK